MKSGLILVPIFFLLILIAGLILLPFPRVKYTYASNSASLNYTALGDSITLAPPSFTDGTPNYVDRYKNYISIDLGVPVNTTNLGIIGINSTNLLDHLKTDQNFRDSVKTANLITVMIGINDYVIVRGPFFQGTCGGTDNQDCLRNAVNLFKNNLTSIVSEIKSINQNSNTLILLSDFYNPFISIDKNSSNSSILIPYVNQMNSYVHSIGGSNGLNVANVYQAFNGPDGMQDPVAKGYIFDGIHPSGQGHEVIATQFRNLNSVLLSKDTDGDGFSNGAEKYYGTDLLASCPRNSSHSAYPPDFTNDGLVRVGDILAVINKFNTLNNPRYDLNRDGVITVADILMERNYFAKDCTP